MSGEVNNEPAEFQGFEWDANKSEATLAERGFGFDVAARALQACTSSVRTYADLWSPENFRASS